MNKSRIRAWQWLVAAALIASAFVAPFATASDTESVQLRATPQQAAPVQSAFKSEPHQVLLARVSDTGTLVNGYGVKSSVKTDEGITKVVFKRDVSQCALSATVAPTAIASGATVYPSTGAFVGLMTPSTTVYVVTFQDGFMGSLAFHITAACP